MRKEGRRGKEGDGREMSQKKRGQIRHSRTFRSVLEVFTRQLVPSPSEAHSPSRPPSAQGCDQQPASPNDALSLKTSLVSFAKSHHLFLSFRLFLNQMDIITTCISQDRCEG